MLAMFSRMLIGSVSSKLGAGDATWPALSRLDRGKTGHPSFSGVRDFDGEGYRSRQNSDFDHAEGPVVVHVAAGRRGACTYRVERADLGDSSRASRGDRGGELERVVDRGDGVCCEVAALTRASVVEVVVTAVADAAARGVPVPHWSQNAAAAISDVIRARPVCWVCALTSTSPNAYELPQLIRPALQRVPRGKGDQTQVLHAAVCAGDDCAN